MRNITRIEIAGRLPSEISRGHRPHRSGAGKHLDKRTKRARTRNASLRKVIEE